MGLLSKTKGHTPAAVDRSPQAARPAHVFTRQGRLESL